MEGQWVLEPQEFILSSMAQELQPEIMEEEIKLNFLGLHELQPWSPTLGDSERDVGFGVRSLGLNPFVPPVELITLEGLIILNLFPHG